MIDVVRVGPDEWSTVRKVRLAALLDTPDLFWSTHDDEVDKPESWWREFVDAGAWFVAYDGGLPVGISAAIRDPELEESDRQLISMWVEPDARGGGVGAKLIEAVKAWARADGARALQLQVT